MNYFHVEIHNIVRALCFINIIVCQLLRKEEQLSQQERQLQQKDAEVQAARRGLSDTQGKLHTLQQQHEESCRLSAELEIDR